MLVTRRRTMIATVAAAALIATGCGDDADSETGSGGDDRTAAAETQTEDDDASSDAMGAISSPGVDLRVTLDRLLAEHASVGLAALTKTIDGEPDAQAAVGALQGNTEDLTAAIASVYGDDAGEAFQTQWEAHIGMFVNYATGVKNKDEAAKAKAKRDLAGYQQSFAKFLNDAAGLDARAAAAALGMHVQQLTRAMDAYGAGNYAAYYDLERDAYEHMFATGDALAQAISKQKPDEFGTGNVAKATADTRVLLDRQLGEHAYLAAIATTESLIGTKDAKAAVAALEANTVDLGNTIESVYGSEAEQAFLSQWRAHIGFFVDYTMALASDDEQALEKATEALDGYSENFAKFLADATGGDEDAFRASLEEHVEQLTGALDAADAGDLERAWELEREAYAHMFMTGDAIVAAIVAQNPEMFPAADGEAMDDME